MFKYVEWNEMPQPSKKIRGGKVVVTRNVTQSERDGVVFYYGEMAIMSEASYAAYVGAKEVMARRENEIIDDYTLSLIEEGVL